jgi:hypothetical protein
MFRSTSLLFLCLFSAAPVLGQSLLPQVEQPNARIVPLGISALEATMPQDPLSRLGVSSRLDSALQVQASEPAAMLSAEQVAPAGGGGGGGGENNGTNPAAPVTSFSAQNEYFALKGGDSINTVYTRFKYPWFGGKGGVTLEIPYVYYDLSGSAPTLPHVGGLGDVAINTSYNLWQSESKKITVVGLFNTFIPTADNLLVSRPLPVGSLAAFNLGTGKYVLAPGAALVYAFAPNFFIAPLYLFECSAFGNEEQPDIRRGKFRLFAMYAWKSGVYLLPEFQALTNYQNGSTDFYLAPELGYTTKGTTLLIKPGFGLDAKPGEREWGISFGAKINF